MGNNPGGGRAHGSQPFHLNVARRLRCLRNSASKPLQVCAEPGQSSQTAIAPRNSRGAANSGGAAADVKEWLKARCTPATILRLRKAAGLADRLLLSWWCPDDLNRLALIYGTDKWGYHWYTQHYDRYFKTIRSRRLNVLEIGVGGYDVPSQGAHGLRMWKAYFAKSLIVGIDVEDKTAWCERRIDIRQCDQTDADALKKLSEEYGGFDIIIDDGSHINQHVIATFEVLFPLLRSNGVYAVEDTQTACWPTWGGGVENPANSLAYFKRLVDGLNYSEYPIHDYRPTYFDENIVEISFFHNLIIIRKGRNEDRSNCPQLIEKELENTQSPTAHSSEGPKFAGERS